MQFRGLGLGFDGVSSRYPQLNTIIYTDQHDVSGTLDTLTKKQKVHRTSVRTILVGFPKLGVPF